MDNQRKAIRALLQSMAPKRAREYIKSFELPEDEDAVLIICDVRGKSEIIAADILSMSLEVVKDRRKSAYAHIADALNN